MIVRANKTLKLYITLGKHYRVKELYKDGGFCIMQDYGKLGYVNKLHLDIVIVKSYIEILGSSVSN